MSPPEKAEPRSAPPQKIFSPAPVMMTERTLSSACTLLSAALSSRISVSLIALAGGRFSVMTAQVSSRSRIRVSNPIPDDSFEKDRGHRLRCLRELVAPLAQDPGRGHLVHCAEQHFGGDFHRQGRLEAAGGHALFQDRADQVEVG